jgi:hypothetical protein
LIVSQLKVVTPEVNKDLVETLERWTEMAHKGELRSVALVGVRPDSSVPSAWACAPGDALKVLQFILATDLIESRS